MGQEKFYLPQWITMAQKLALQSSFSTFIDEVNLPIIASGGGGKVPFC